VETLAIDGTSISFRTETRCTGGIPCLVFDGGSSDGYTLSYYTNAGTLKGWTGLWGYYNEYDDDFIALFQPVRNGAATSVGRLNIIDWAQITMAPGILYLSDARDSSNVAFLDIDANTNAYIKLNSTAPYFQFSDDTGSATDYYILNDANYLSFYSGSYSTGTEEARLTATEFVVVDDFRVVTQGGNEGLWAYDATAGGNNIYSLLRGNALNHTVLTTYDGFGLVNNSSTSSTSFMFFWDAGGRNNNEFTVKGRTNNTGSDIGSVVIVERGDNAATDIPGMVLLYEADGGYGFLYLDNAGLLRVADALGTDVPEADGTPANNAGAVIGDQTSSLEKKDVVLERDDPNYGLNLILQTRVFDFTYKNGGYNGETFTGIITNYAPWLGKDGGQTLNEVNAVGLLVQSVQALQQQIVELEAELNDLKVKVKDKKDPKPATDISKKTKPDKTIPPTSIPLRDALYGPGPPIPKRAPTPYPLPPPSGGI
jgi:hypothetical protein